MLTPSVRPTLVLKLKGIHGFNLFYSHQEAALTLASTHGIGPIPIRKRQRCCWRLVWIGSYQLFNTSYFERNWNGFKLCIKHNINLHETNILNRGSKIPTQWDTGYRRHNCNWFSLKAVSKVSSRLNIRGTSSFLMSSTWRPLCQKCVPSKGVKV